MASIRSSIRVGFVVASLIATALACGPMPGARRVDAARSLRLSAGYGSLPMHFEANEGPSDDPVRFLARGQGYSLFLTQAEAVLSLRAGADVPAGRDAVVRMRLGGANPHPRLTGLDRLPGTSNYFIGSDAARWRRDVPNYARVKYAGVYPGIDLIYYGNQRQLEYDIVVGPKADPGKIALEFEGVEALSLDPEGNLVLRTARGDLAQRKPVIYQDIGGRRRTVEGRYVLGAGHQVGFELDGYDTTAPVVIDPVLSYSTYLGGNSNDIGHAIAVDSAGNAYVTGLTRSTNFPGASGGPIQPAWQGSDDVFVTKINAAGTALVYSTYLGGNGGDIGFAIAVDSAGQAYVTGETTSSTAGGANIPFPIVGAFQPLYHQGPGDAFVTKLNAAGNALVYSTYLGGSGVERGTGIAVDGSGNAYLTGSTNSLNQALPATDFPLASPFQSQNGGSYDAFVTKLNAAGSGLVYSTFLGGTASESSIDGGAIAVDGDGNAYVGGTTASSDFPGTKVIQATNGGGVSDGFVVKFNAAGNALVYSTYLGGNLYDAVNGIAIDTAQNAYVTGYTDSPNFPTAVPLQPNLNGSANDAFVSRINAAGTALVYSTYLGGSGSDAAYAVAVNDGGSAFVSGRTSSANFPMAAPLQGGYAGSGDAFISEFTQSGALAFSTYWGGAAGAEHGRGIALDSGGSLYMTGETNSFNFPATAGAFQTSLAAFTDAFVVRFAAPPVLGPPTDLRAIAITGNSVTIGWTAPAGGITPTGYVLEGGTAPGDVLATIQTFSTDTTFAFTAPTGTFYIRIRAAAGGATSPASNEIRIIVNVTTTVAPSAPVNLQGTATGHHLALAWTNTASGGSATGQTLDVTGAFNGSLGLPVSETYSLAGVPAGTYTLSVRAFNSAGSSGSSNAVTLTFPGTCEAPATPIDMVATTSGNVVNVSWKRGAGGPAPASYTVVVTGAFNGTLTVQGLSISGAVGPGSYTVTIAGTNACGTSAPTAPLTVTIP